MQLATARNAGTSPFVPPTRAGGGGPPGLGSSNLCVTPGSGSSGDREVALTVESVTGRRTPHRQEGI